MTNGGGSKLPAIYAKFPVGSVCTCTNGTRTMTAGDTSGFWLFANLEIGTWTITATDGTDSVSKTVEITAEGQSENVELSFGQYFYNKGDEYTDITGGWVKGTSSAVLGTFSKNAESMSIATGSNTVMIIGTGIAIDMSPYKTLEIIFNTAQVGTGVRQCLFGLSPNLNSDTPFSASVRVSDTRAIVDVESINTASKIALYVGSSNNVDVQAVKGHFK